MLPTPAAPNSPPTLPPTQPSRRRLAQPTLGSLRQRLLAAAALWISFALGVVGVLLVLLFHRHVEEELAGRAQGQLDALVAGLQVVPRPSAAAAPAAPATPAASAASTPELRMDREPPEPAFQQPLGGWYWLVSVDGAVLLRSRSWWDHPLDALPAATLRDAAPDAVTRLRAEGPAGQSLLLWARRVELAGLGSPVVVAVGADTARLKDMTQSYALTVSLALALLALALWAAAWLQVRLGLAPLARLQAALRDLRQSQQRRIEGRHPAEVQPLVDELNDVLRDHDALLEQARQQAGSLAHALKTPLAVIGNAAVRWPDAEGELIRQQLDLMHRQVEWHLLRARAAAHTHATQRAGISTPLRPVLEDLQRVLQRLYAERALSIELDLGLEDRAGRTVGVAIQADPLKEMLGNLLDNACKWAARRIRITARVDAADPSRLRIDIDDDGPGIPEARRAEALQRGRRLDERLPGSGLGLAIVDELAQIHGGSLELAASDWQGLRVVLTLPCR